jgi:hypothetical protein
MPISWGAVDSSRLEPQFKADVEKLLSESPYHWYVTFGYRSNELQKVLYDKYLAGGPKAAPPGSSAHNYGLAVDVVLDIDAEKPGLQPSWNTKLAGWLWLFAKVKLHPRLKSGVSFGDGGHIERYKWQKHKDWRGTLPSA